MNLKKLRELIPARLYCGDSETVQLTKRYSFTVALEHDADMGPPWEEHDGHGPVSDWRPKESKRPGERVLFADNHGRARFYDFAEAVKIARRDSWGTTGDEGMSRGARAAHAAEADFKRMRAWCTDDWTWVGVDVRLLHDGAEVQRNSCWGIESDSDYWCEVAAELLSECLRTDRTERRAARAAARDAKHVDALRRCFC
jgi:hypothetical protein